MSEEIETNSLSEDAAVTESPAHALTVWGRAGTWEEQREVDWCLGLT